MKETWYNGYGTGPPGMEHLAAGFISACPSEG